MLKKIATILVVVAAAVAAVAHVLVWLVGHATQTHKNIQRRERDGPTI